jgi:DNA-binding FrmR family transcriptional regulator
MIEDDRYCLDISHQLLATQAVLRRANKEVIASHMKHCVGNASTQEELDLKVEELIQLIDDLIK